MQVKKYIFVPWSISDTFFAFYSAGRAFSNSDRMAWWEVFAGCRIYLGKVLWRHLKWTEFVWFLRWITKLSCNPPFNFQQKLIFSLTSRREIMRIWRSWFKLFRLFGRSIFWFDLIWFEEASGQENVLPNWSRCLISRWSKIVFTDVSTTKLNWKHGNLSDKLKHLYI